MLQSQATTILGKFGVPINVYRNQTLIGSTIGVETKAKTGVTEVHGYQPTSSINVVLNFSLEPHINDEIEFLGKRYQVQEILVLRYKGIVYAYKVKGN